MISGWKIRFTMKTVNGFESICEFYAGNNKAIATAIFNALEGNDTAGNNDILQFDLLEMRKGLPCNLQIKHCTLSEMTNNCRILTREIFKYRNLADSSF